MAYCTEADVANAIGGDPRLVQLADWLGTGSADSTAVSDAIEEASELLDSYARAHHSVPFADAEVPGIVRRKTAREAVYLLAINRGQIPEFLATQHAEFLVWLEDLGRGRVKLVPKTDEPADAEQPETGELGETGKFDSPDLGGLW